MLVDRQHTDHRYRGGRRYEGLRPSPECQRDTLGLLDLLPKAGHERGARVGKLAGLVILAKQIVQPLIFHSPPPVLPVLWDSRAFNTLCLARNNLTFRAFSFT